MKSKKTYIIVHRFPGHKSLGVLHYNGWTCLCAIGRGGLGLKKREGDGISPIGKHKLRGVHVRADRLPYLKTALPMRHIKPTDWWCDDPNARRYNRLMEHIPAPEGHEERLWRQDHLYDIIIEIGYNDDPVKRGKGSAIFIHAAREGLTPTAGCVALARADLLRLIQRLQWPASIVLL